MFENDSKEGTNRPWWLYFTFEISLIAFPRSVVPRNPIDFPLLFIPSRRSTRWNILRRTSLTWSFPEDWTRINPHSRTAHFQLVRLIVDDDDTSRPSGFTFQLEKFSHLRGIRIVAYFWRVRPCLRIVDSVELCKRTNCCQFTEFI